jgi:hypothetical protein
MSSRNSPASVAYLEDDIKFKYSNKRERDDHKFETNYYKKNIDLHIGDCCFMSKTAPPQYLGKVVNKIKNDDGTIQIDFQQHDGNIYTDIKPENYAYVISPNIETPNPFAKKVTIKGGKKTKRKSKKTKRKSKNIKHKKTKRKSKK